MLNFPVIHHPERLKIGILLINRDHPVWVARILSMISGLSFLETSLIIPRDEDSFEDISPDAIKDGDFFQRIFARFDQIFHLRKISPGKKTEFDPNNYSDQIFPFPLMVRNGRIAIINQNQFQKLNEMKLDLILYFEDFPLDDHFFDAARFGILAYAHQFLEWRIPEKVITFLFDLSKSGFKSLAKDPYTSTFPLKDNWTILQQSEFMLVLLMIKVFLGKVIHRLFEGVYKERWEIAYQFSDKSIFEVQSFQPQIRLMPPVKKIFGDPFPVKMGGRYFLFFEEMTVDEVSYKLTGNISTLEIDREKGPIGKIRNVLQRDYHLSYPFVFSWKNEFYMLPETHQNRTIELYRCISFPDKWEFYKTLLKDIPAVDVTLFEKDGTWWMFAAMPQKALEDSNEFFPPHLYELNLYYSDSPVGDWHSHPQNPVKVNRTSTRCAGNVLFHEGFYYRPAQDCTPRYGHAVVFNRIEKLNTTEYLETENIKIIPSDHWQVLGVHTYNACEDFQVIDFISYRNRFLP